VQRYAEPPDDREPAAVGPCHAQAGGFDLHAAILTRAGQRDRLERLCRYALRPPLAEDRLEVDGEGAVWLTLRHRWSDGTTHLKFEPLELLERLAVLTPRPRINLSCPAAARHSVWTLTCSTFSTRRLQPSFCLLPFCVHVS
jgi:Putative transposase